MNDNELGQPGRLDSIFEWRFSVSIQGLVREGDYVARSARAEEENVV